MDFVWFPLFIYFSGGECTLLHLLSYTYDILRILNSQGFHSEVIFVFRDFEEVGVDHHGALWGNHADKNEENVDASPTIP